MLPAGVGWVVITRIRWYKAVVTLIFCLYRSWKRFRMCLRACISSAGGRPVCQGAVFQILHCGALVYLRAVLQP
ncbi:MAG: hypothetical protein ACLT0Y_00900 [Christensenellales bacterium]